MKLRYQERKGHRVKSRGFFGVRSGFNTGLWWFSKQKMWARPGTFDGSYGNHAPAVNSIRAFRRYLRKLAKVLPSGTEFILCSRYFGHDIYGKVPKSSSKRKRK